MNSLCKQSTSRILPAFYMSNFGPSKVRIYRLVFTSGKAMFFLEDTLGKTLSRRSEIAAKWRVEFFYFQVFIQSVIIFSLSLRLAREKPNSRKNMIFHIFCLIKKLCKMRKFAKFTLVISLFKYFRKNFLDRFLNLLREITCLQNVFFDVGFLIYFELFKTFLRYSDISIEPMQGIALSICTSPHYLG